MVLQKVHCQGFKIARYPANLAKYLPHLSKIQVWVILHKLITHLNFKIFNNKYISSNMY